MNNSDKRFDPEAELKMPITVERHWARPLIIFCFFFMMISVWAYTCRGCMRSDSPFSTADNGSGGSDMGDGSGSGESGDGPGAGKSGSGKGKTNARGRVGTGATAQAPGSSSPSTGKVRADAPGESRIINTTPPPQIEQLAQQQNTTQVKTIPTPKTGGTSAGQSGKYGKYGVARKGFYGLEIRKNEKILFIVDTSGSMAAPSKELPGKNRLDVLKLELQRSIFEGNKTDRKNGGFILLSFNSFTTAFPKKSMCSYSDSIALQQARSFIDSMACGGGTMMIPAWEHAFDICKRRGINTIYFMTDGYPGDAFDDAWLQKKLKKRRLTELKINCVAVGEDRDFMRKISKMTKGQYIFIP